MDETRDREPLDWLVRVYTPAWLDLAGLSTEAQVLRDLRPIVDLTAAKDAGSAVRAAKIRAHQAWNDIWSGEDNVWIAARADVSAAAADALRATPGPRIATNVATVIWNPGGGTHWVSLGGDVMGTSMAAAGVAALIVAKAAARTAAINVAGDAAWESKWSRLQEAAWTAGRVAAVAAAKDKLATVTTFFKLGNTPWVPLAT